MKVCGDSRLRLIRDSPGTEPFGTDGGSGQPFDDHGHAHPAADAHGFQPDRAVGAAQTVDQGAGDPGPAHPEGVPEGDGPAVHVQLVDVDAQVAVAGADLGGERLVDLDEIEVADV